MNETPSRTVLWSGIVPKVWAQQSWQAQAQKKQEEGNQNAGIVKSRSLAKQLKQRLYTWFSF